MYLDSAPPDTNSGSGAGSSAPVGDDVPAPATAPSHHVDTDSASASAAGTVADAADVHSAAGTPAPAERRRLHHHAGPPLTITIAPPVSDAAAAGDAPASASATVGGASPLSSTAGSATAARPFTCPPSLDLCSPSRRSATPSAYSAAVVQSPVRQAFAVAAHSTGSSTNGQGQLATALYPGSVAAANRHRTPSMTSLRAVAHAHAHALRPPQALPPQQQQQQLGAIAEGVVHHHQHPQQHHAATATIQQQHHLLSAQQAAHHQQIQQQQYLQQQLLAAGASSQYAPIVMGGGTVQLPDGSALPYSSVALPLTVSVPSVQPMLNQEAQDQLLQLAHAKYNAADYAAALSVLQTLFLVNPTSIATLLLLGCTCYSLGLYPLSVFYNQLILGIDAHFAEAYSNLGTTYRALADDARAEQCYRVAVEIRPEYWDGARNLVGILCAKGQWDEALAVYERAERTIASCDPGLWPAERKRDLYHAKANIRFATGDAEGARRDYMHALRCVGIDPAAVVAEFTKLTASTSGGTAAAPTVVPPEDALALAQPLLAAAPTYQTLAATPAPAGLSDPATTSTILQTLAKFYQDAQQLVPALALYYFSLAVSPNPQTCNLVGILCATLGMASVAVRYYHFGLKLDPNHVHLYTNLGSALKDGGHVMEAIIMYERAVQLNPEFDIALANLANSMKDIGRIDEAVGLYRRALAANPQFIEAFCNYVNTLNFICDWRDRDANFARIRDLTDRQLEVMAGTLAWSQTFHMSENASPQRALAIRTAQHQPPPTVPTVLPFHTFTYPLTARQIRLISFRNAARMVHNVYTAPWYPAATGYAPIPPPAAAGERLRVGYVSSDFGNHPLSHLMQSVFGMHDRARFEVFGYALTPNDGTPYRAKIERETEHLRDVSGWSPGQICDQINRVDRIHILINLNGYTKGALNEVFAARCAPVQLSYMGFAGTLGACGWIDYFIVDPVVAPPDLVFPGRVTAAMVESTADDTHVYTEKMMYMPHSYFVNDHKQGFRDDGAAAAAAAAAATKAGNVTSDPAAPPAAPVPPPAVVNPERAWLDDEALRWRMRLELFPGLSRDAVILANFNQAYKLDPVILASWCRILARVPNAVIWLLRFPSQSEPHIRRTASEYAGPEVASRFVFTDVAPKQIHISRGRVVDLFLDSPECNAHTTACDILFSGTPIVTFPRHRAKLCSRVAASIALATGYGERMIVASEREYEERVVALAASVRVRVVADPAGSSSSSAATSAMADLSITKNGAATDDSSTAGSASALPPVATLLNGSPGSAATQVPGGILPPGSRLETTGELYDLKRALFLTRESSPLFDTHRWVRNLEKGFEAAWAAYTAGQLATDNIWIRDEASDPLLGDPQRDPRLRFMAHIDARAAAAAAAAVSHAMVSGAMVAYQHPHAHAHAHYSMPASAASMAMVAAASSVAAAATLGRPAAQHQSRMLPPHQQQQVIVAPAAYPGSSPRQRISVMHHYVGHHHPAAAAAAAAAGTMSLDRGGAAHHHQQQQTHYHTLPQQHPPMPVCTQEKLEEENRRLTAKLEALRASTAADKAEIAQLSQEKAEWKDAFLAMDAKAALLVESLAKVNERLDETNRLLAQYNAATGERLDAIDKRLEALAAKDESKEKDKALYTAKAAERDRIDRHIKTKRVLDRMASFRDQLERMFEQGRGVTDEVEAAAKEETCRSENDKLRKEKAERDTKITTLEMKVTMLTQELETTQQRLDWAMVKIEENSAEDEVTLLTDELERTQERLDWALDKIQKHSADAEEKIDYATKVAERDRPDRRVKAKSDGKETGNRLDQLFDQGRGTLDEVKAGETTHEETGEEKPESSASPPKK
ncbi:hypothetical protein H9P43_004274 [Blastocladiella emersonii ATCC 22665]|nr:hypothetical protein H9P43_004274 [Blastocladiella emersonii ATCC 22665]